MGYGYRFLNGIGFATVYSVFIGKTAWWGQCSKVSSSSRWE